MAMQLNGNHRNAFISLDMWWYMATILFIAHLVIHPPFNVSVYIKSIRQVPINCALPRLLVLGTRELKSSHETKDLFERTGDEPELSSLPDQMDWKLNPITLTRRCFFFLLSFFSSPHRITVVNIVIFRTSITRCTAHKNKTLSVVDDDDDRWP